MVMTGNYATLSELKSRLRITADDAAVDATLEQVILAASRQIDGLTGDVFSATTAETRVLSATATDHLDVPSLRAVTSLLTDEDGDRVYETTWLATDYDLEPFDAAYTNRPYTSIQLAPNGRRTFPRGSRTVQITGNWGWAAVPDAVEEACLILAIRLFKRKDAPYGIAGTPGLGQTQLTIPSIDPDVRQLVAPYRRFYLGAV